MFKHPQLHHEDVKVRNEPTLSVCFHRFTQKLIFCRLRRQIKDDIEELKNSHNQQGQLKLIINHYLTFSADKKRYQNGYHDLNDATDEFPCFVIRRIVICPTFHLQIIVQCLDFTLVFVEGHLLLVGDSTHDLVVLFV